MILDKLKDDFKANKSDVKSVFIVLFFRLSNYFACHRLRIIRFAGLPIRVLYRLIIEFIMSAEIPDRLSVGDRLRIFHGMGLVINIKSVIGNDVLIRHNTTIGSKRDDGLCPILEDGVDVGANVVIIGNITIGKNSIIGAGSVVTKSFPSNSILAGNPAKILSIRNNRQFQKPLAPKSTSS